MNKWSYLPCSYLDVSVFGKEQVVLWASGESAPQVTRSACCSLRRENKKKYESVLLMDAVVQKTKFLFQRLLNLACM